MNDIARSIRDARAKEESARHAVAEAADRSRREAACRELERALGIRTTPTDWDGELRASIVFEGVRVTVKYGHHYAHVDDETGYFALSVVPRRHAPAQYGWNVGQFRSAEEFYVLIAERGLAGTSWQRRRMRRALQK